MILSIFVSLKSWGIPPAYRLKYRATCSPDLCVFQSHTRPMDLEASSDASAVALARLLQRIVDEQINCLLTPEEYFLPSDLRLLSEIQLRELGAALGTLVYKVDGRRFGIRTGYANTIVYACSRNGSPCG